MGKLSDLIKSNLKDGADISEIEMLIDKLTIDNIDSKEKALDFIKRNDYMSRGLDYAISESVKNHDLKFQTEKVPIIREELEREIKNKLNPPKTEAEERLAIVEAKYLAMEQKEARLLLEKELRNKARELSYPEDKAERFAVYGDSAYTHLEQDAEFYKSRINEKVEAEIKTRFGNNPQPRTSAPITGISSMSISQLNDLARDNPGQKMDILQEIKNRTKPTA